MFNKSSSDMVEHIVDGVVFRFNRQNYEQKLSSLENGCLCTNIIPDSISYHGHDIKVSVSPWYVSISKSGISLKPKSRRIETCRCASTIIGKVDILTIDVYEFDLLRAKFIVESILDKEVLSEVAVKVKVSGVESVSNLKPYDYTWELRWSHNRYRLIGYINSMDIEWDITNFMPSTHVSQD